ncbi:hypothetical protein [Paenarthrobacter sp. PH39-S1]|uniref:hypothetical protein n=1 Tax=Micrococcaceae TaxID=1268 RepID=UPI0024B94F32|nr:hypothetical protein [Paenarthrobacter sp. PH39-S1]MDJ0355419.1 hypothetical protein [Paenarthrobacter sp. PH39-S1]
MNILPASYLNYLEGKPAAVVATVKPVLQQSAADRLHGVRVKLLQHDEIQAVLDERIPFGEILEAID